MTNEQRLALLAECKPSRICTYGSNQWAIVHEPSANVVPGPPEVIDYGLGARPISGPLYFPRKKDAQAALDKLRTVLSGHKNTSQE